MDLGARENKGHGTSPQRREQHQGLSKTQSGLSGPQFGLNGISTLLWTNGCWSFLNENIYYSYFTPDLAFYMVWMGR